jgi:UDP-N-acetylmuramate: L-alanyl-gamma-D-glutamyl-meso-diaminopimelate ligase
MGICGTGVGALAGMLQAAGYKVSGSDQHIYPPMGDFLARLGIRVMAGYGPQNLSPLPDLVIVGNVITRQNPEAVALAASRVPYLSMPQALAEFFLRGKTSLVVSGTHGKTTTSSMLATILHYAGLDPGFMIGGLVREFGRNFNIGAGPHFVVEGDEYDTAFFDKGPKFLHYQPRIAIITSIEFDHADIYADLAAIKASFRQLVRIMPADGRLIANLDDPVVREIVEDAACPVLAYGQSRGLNWVLDDLQLRADGAHFNAIKDGRDFGRFRCPMPGRHNAMNSLAVLAALDQLHLTAADCAGYLARFTGVCRRQEVRGEVGGVLVIDDFAHHPTAVRETLAALRAAYAGRRLRAVFEPRTNSSRRRVFQDIYLRVFDDADEIIVKEPAPLANVPQAARFSARQLISDLQKKGHKARYFAATGGILTYLAESAASGDVIAIMSNGGFDNIHSRLLELLEKKFTAAGF